jgi:hypothetical protein
MHLQQNGCRGILTSWHLHPADQLHFNVRVRKPVQKPSRRVGG